MDAATMQLVAAIAANKAGAAIMETGDALNVITPDERSEFMLRVAAHLSATLGKASERPNHQALIAEYAKEVSAMVGGE